MLGTMKQLHEAIVASGDLRLLEPALPVPMPVPGLTRLRFQFDGSHFLFDLSLAHHRWPVRYHKHNPATMHCPSSGEIS